MSVGDVHAGLAEDAEEAAVGVARRSSCGPRASGSLRTAAMRWAWMRGVGLGDVRVDARGRGRDRVDRHAGGRQAGVVGPLEREVGGELRRGRSRAPTAWLGPRLAKYVAVAL